MSASSPERPASTLPATASDNLSPVEVQFVSRLLEEMTGIELDEGKSYVVQTRIAQVARSMGLRSPRELVHKLVRQPRDEALAVRVVDALLNKETYFFRHPEVFTALQRHLVPNILGQTTLLRPLRVWSAACSTGQEPYSIAMARADVGLCQRPGELDLLATDISATAIDYARQGSYTQLEVSRGLPAPMLVRYFRQEGYRFSVAPWLQRGIRFVRQSLFEATVPAGYFDIIFCRNVAIYYPDARKTQLFELMARSLAPGGSLFVGATECASRYTPVSTWMTSPASRS